MLDGNSSVQFKGAVTKQGMMAASITAPAF
jgi:hypothetical protein